jgi:hypothetical protein
VTRAPLELLDDLCAEAEVLYLNCDPVMVTLKAAFARLEPALRAQAEANKELRKALAHYAELRHYDHAGRVWSGDPDEHEDAQVDFGEIARAALAQAAVKEEP